jgi:ribosomal protein L37E
MSFLPIHRILPRWSNSAGSYDLGLGNVNGPTVDLLYGSLVELDVLISGANKDVYFYITDSNGRRVFDVGRIYDGYHLEWQATAFGPFRLNFDNTMSWVSHKYVNWSYGVFHYKTLFFFLGIGLLILGTLQIFREEKVIHKIRKLIFKEPETLVTECQYCGNTYSKTLDKCPHCGAFPKKVRIPRKEKEGEEKKE